MSRVIEEELQSLIMQVDNILSKPFLSYYVEFGDFKFKFEQPTTKEEIETFNSKKKEYISYIFADALKTLVNNIVYEKTPEFNKIDFEGNPIEGDRPWKVIDQFLISDVTKEEIVSEYGADVIKAIKEKAAEAAKDGTNKIALDIDNVYVAQQLQKDWTEEDQEKLIRKNEEL